MTWRAQSWCSVMIDSGEMMWRAWRQCAAMIQCVMLIWCGGPVPVLLPLRPIVEVSGIRQRVHLPDCHTTAFRILDIYMDLPTDTL
jgi:hypothetical protein